MDFISPKRPSEPRTGPFNNEVLFSQHRDHTHPLCSVQWESSEAELTTKSKALKPNMWHLGCSEYCWVSLSRIQFSFIHIAPVQDNSCLKVILHSKDPTTLEKQQWSGLWAALGNSEVKTNSLLRGSELQQHQEGQLSASTIQLCNVSLPVCQWETNVQCNSTLFRMSQITDKLIKWINSIPGKMRNVTFKHFYNWMRADFLTAPQSH